VTGARLVDPVSTLAVLMEAIRAGCRDIDTTPGVPAPIVRALQQARVFRLMARWRK
jgi:hypothetical protein